MHPIMEHPTTLPSLQHHSKSKYRCKIGTKLSHPPTASKKTRADFPASL